MKSLYLVLVLLPFTLFAQSKHGELLIDSLQKVLPTCTHDTDRARILDIISFTYANINPDKGIVYAQQSLKLSEKAGWKKGVASANADLGILFANMSEHSKAIYHHVQALNLYKELGLKKSSAGVLANISLVYLAQSQHHKALEYAFKALAENEEIGNKQTSAVVLENIGTIYLEEKQYTKTMEYYTRALKLYESLGDYQGVARNYGNTGIVLDVKGDYAQSLAYHFKALAANQKYGDKSSVQINLANIGYVYSHMKNYQQALKYQFMALEQSEEMENKSGIAIDMGNIGETYFSIAKETKDIPALPAKKDCIKQAIYYLQKAVLICDEIGFSAPQIEFTKYLSDAYTLSGDYKNALFYYQQSMQLRDTIFSQQNKIKLANLETQRELDIRDKAILIKNREIEIAKLHASNKKRETALYLSGIVFLLICLAWGINKFKARNKIHRSQLEHQESRLKQAQAIAHVGSWEYNFIQGTATWSDEAYAIFGLQPGKQIISMDVWMSHIHPDDLTAVKKALEQAETLRKEASLQHRIIRQDGQTRYIYVENHYEYDKHGQATGLYGIVHDMTDIRQTQEQLIRSEKIYKTIASSITGSVIYMIDTEYRYILIEGDMCKAWGYTPEHQVNIKISDIMPMDAFAELRENFKQVFEGHYFTTETRIGKYDILTKYAPLKDENDNVYAALVVCLDISKLKSAQRALAELNQALEARVMERTAQWEEANKELEAFSYSVSHDLRAPLRAIQGYTQILQETQKDNINEEGQYLIQKTLDNTKRMGHLIQELLAFSKISKQKLSKHVLSMQDLVNQVIDELTVLEKGRDIVFNLSELPDIEADKSTMKQVWYNLISNAIKYSRNKEKAILDIGAEKKDKEIIFHIRDNGAGFDMQYSDKLFGVFQRLHSDSEFEGIGVGLAIVHRIILKHEGKIWAEGKKDEGATFYFSLPVGETHLNTSEPE